MSLPLPDFGLWIPMELRTVPEPVRPSGTFLPGHKYEKQRSNLSYTCFNKALADSSQRYLHDTTPKRILKERKSETFTISLYLFKPTFSLCWFTAWSWRDTRKYRSTMTWRPQGRRLLCFPCFLSTSKDGHIRSIIIWRRICHRLDQKTGAGVALLMF